MKSKKAKKETKESPRNHWLWTLRNFYFSGFVVLAKSGLKPLIIERGPMMDERVKAVDKGGFFKDGLLNTEANVQFGEGGAVTFSDGKLYTLVNDPRSKFIFEEFVKAGAPAEILFSATPHIGTDRLRK